MQILRKYQLDIIFLFLVLAAIDAITLSSLKFIDQDFHQLEWIITLPLMLLFVVWLSNIRAKIQLSERRRLTGKTLFYWIVLGIIIFINSSTPVSVRNFESTKIFFIIFTLFLADSYWDFKKLTIKNIFKK